MNTAKTIIHLKNKPLVSLIKPLKKFDFNDCLKLKDKGYAFFGTDFCERPSEDCLILYPFQNETAARKFSKTDSELDPLVIEITDDLKNLTDQISGINIYVQFL